MPNEFKFVLTDTDKLRHFYKLYEQIFITPKSKSVLFEYWSFVEKCIQQKLQDFFQENDYRRLASTINVNTNSVTQVIITVKFIKANT
jgi:hypothetical protein